MSDEEPQSGSDFEPAAAGGSDSDVDLEEEEAPKPKKATPRNRAAPKKKGEAMGCKSGCGTTDLELAAHVIHTMAGVCWEGQSCLLAAAVAFCPQFRLPPPICAAAAGDAGEEEEDAGGSGAKKKRQPAKRPKKITDVTQVGTPGGCMHWVHCMQQGWQRQLTLAVACSCSASASSKLPCQLDPNVAWRCPNLCWDSVSPS